MQAFELQLNKIRETILMMSSLVDRNIGMAMRALLERSDTLADTVESEDTEIDRLEVELDDLVVTYMATHGPMASDCRLMVIATKISYDLERIGDMAVTVARKARELNMEPQLKPLIDIPRMAQIGQGMLRDSIKGFVAKQSEEMKEIIERDVQVDGINRQLQRELMTFMMEDPKTITRALNLMRVSAALERMADHAKNIAEEIYFLYQAKDIRHEKVLSGGK